MQAWESPAERGKMALESRICSVCSLMRIFIATASFFAHKTKAHCCQQVKQSTRSGLGRHTATRAEAGERGLRSSDRPWLPVLCVAPMEASAGNRAGAWCVSGILAPVIKWELFADNYGTKFLPWMTESKHVPDFKWLRSPIDYPSP